MAEGENRETKMKPSIDTNSLLDKISSRIETKQKPMTAIPGKRRTIKDPIIGAETETVWSRIASEMQEDEKTRALLLPQKMERRKAIESEHRYRRSIYKADEPKHPFAVT